MIVVGLAGGIGQGKTTVGQQLRQLAGSTDKADLEFSYPICEVVNLWMPTWPVVETAPVDMVTFANQLVQSLVPILATKSGKPVTFEQLEVTDESSKLVDYLKRRFAAGARLAEEFPTPLSPANKSMHRELLMWLGATTVENVNERIWSDMIAKRIETLENRGEPLVTVGGVRAASDAAMIHEHGGVIVRVVRPGVAQDSDSTETWSTQWQSDVIIHNDGTLEQLQAAVSQLWDDLRLGKPKTEYRTA